MVSMCGNGDITRSAVLWVGLARLFLLMTTPQLVGPGLRRRRPLGAIRWLAMTSAPHSIPLFCSTDRPRDKAFERGCHRVSCFAHLAIRYKVVRLTVGKSASIPSMRMEVSASILAT